MCLVTAVATQQQAPSSQQPEQPTFRAGANYVRVDMYPTRNGQPVEDLRQDEIELLEDGKPQRIETFEHIHIRPAAPTDVRVDPESVARSREQAADPRARVFVVFLDTYHTQTEGSARMREPLVRFIDSVLGPDDLIAVMTPEMSAADLTLARKTTVLSRMISDNTFWGRRDRGIIDNDPKDDLYDVCYPPTSQTSGPPDSPIATAMKARRREKLTLDALEDLATHLNGIREERKAVLVVTEGWLLFTPDRRLMDAQGDQPPPLGVPPGDRFGRRPSDGNTSTGQSQAGMRVECDADRIALASIDDQARLLRIGEDANRGNVSFYTVYARGMVAFDAPIGPAKPPPPRQDSANLSARQTSLKVLADTTDGTWVITNEIERAMGRIVADLSSYYLLGYYSTNTRLDGGFRSITVRAKRPGIQIRARKGYRSLTADAVRTSATKNVDRDHARRPTHQGVQRRCCRGQSFTAPSAHRVLARRLGSHVEPVGRRRDRCRSPASDDFGAPRAGRRDGPWARRSACHRHRERRHGRRVVLRACVGCSRSCSRRVFDSGARARRRRSIGSLDRFASRGPAGCIVTNRRARAVAPRTGDGSALRGDGGSEIQSNRPHTPRAADPFNGHGVGAVAGPAGRATVGSPQRLDRVDASDGLRWIVVDGTLAPLAAGDYAIEVTLDGTTRVTAIRVKS
jgi:VWFA-related protein